MTTPDAGERQPLGSCAYGWPEGCRYHLPDEWVEWCVWCLKRDGKAVCTCTCPPPDGDDPDCAFHGVPIPKDPEARARLARFAGLSDVERAALDEWCRQQAMEDDAKRRRGLEAHGNDVLGGGR